MSYTLRDDCSTVSNDTAEQIKCLSQQNQLLRAQVVGSSRPQTSELPGVLKIYDRLERENQLTNLKMNEVIGLFRNLASPTSDIGNRLEAFRDILSLTDNIRKNLTTNVGMTRGLMEDTSELITLAAIQADGFNISYEDTLKTLSDTFETVGRQLSIPPEVLSDLTKIDKLFGDVTEDFVSGFDKIGGSSKSAVEAIENAILTSQNMGLVTSKLLPAVSKEISKINTYGFQSGVVGLTKMVAEAQRLGFNFQNALAAADKVFSPEGAIEAAAQLQMIGGAASELLDPFQLMYMAQNDVESLQEAIIDTAKSAVQFNEQTGEFGISPSERMRLKATAEALGQDYENLAETAIKSAREAQAKAQFTVGGIIDDETATLIASMAQIGPGGKFTLSLPEGQFDLTELESALQTQPDLLDSIREQAQKDSLSLEDINRQQLTQSEAIQSNTKETVNLLANLVAMGGMGTTAEEMANLMSTITTGADEFVDVINTVVDDNKLVDKFKEEIQKLTNVLEDREVIGIPQTPQGTTNAQDFIIEPSGDLETFSRGQLRLSPDPMDTIIGGTNLFDTTTIENNTNNTTTNNQGTPNININGTLTLKMDGNSMKISASDFFRAFNPQDYQKLALQINDVVYGSQG